MDKLADLGDEDDFAEDGFADINNDNLTTSWRSPTAI
jgi:hypothetical protein